MKFLVARSSEGAVSKHAPCVEAIRGPEAEAWPGQYEWYVALDSLEQLMQFLNAHGGGLGLWAAEDGEPYPAIEIFDDDEEEDE